MLICPQSQASQSVAATSCQGDCFVPSLYSHGSDTLGVSWREKWEQSQVVASLYLFGLSGPAPREPFVCVWSKQQSASEVRERTGHDSRIKVRDSLENPLRSLSNQEKQLLRRISSASERRNWLEVQSGFSMYFGKAIQIYGAAMNAALRCCKYEEGA